MEALVLQVQVVCWNNLTGIRGLLWLLLFCYYSISVDEVYWHIKCKYYDICIF